MSTVMQSGRAIYLRTEEGRVHIFNVVEVTGGFLVEPILQQKEDAPWISRDWKQQLKRHVTRKHPDGWRVPKFHNMENPRQAVLLSFRGTGNMSTFETLLNHIQGALERVACASNQIVEQVLPPRKRRSLVQL